MWRLTRSAHAASALTGDGGLAGWGRWHRQGVRIVYTAATLSLAALEVLVRVDRWRQVPELVALAIEIPDSLRIEEVRQSRLPSDWRADPEPESTQRLGERWLHARESVVLSVPSAIIPQERNFLLNPAHRDFARVRIESRHAFVFDSRLLPKGRTKPL